MANIVACNASNSIAYLVRSMHRYRKHRARSMKYDSQEKCNITSDTCYILLPRDYILNPCSLLRVPLVGKVSSTDREPHKIRPKQEISLPQPT